jgi:hypothetical protein
MVSMAANIKVVFWNVTPHNLVERFHQDVGILASDYMMSHPTKNV